MNKSNLQSEDWKEIVIKLRDIAIEKGITQDMIAYKSGMLQSSVSRIFALQFIPKLSTIISIAKALEVDIIVKDDKLKAELSFIETIKERNKLITDMDKEISEAVNKLGENP